MFGKLGEVLKKGIDKIAGAILVDKELIDSVVKDLQRALIEADVNVLLVKEISEKIRKAAIDERVKGIEKKEHIIKILHDELKRILGGEKRELVFEKGKNQKVMLLGLYGAGKTTTIAKLAFYYAKRGYKTCMLGLDVHRPAASEQLEQLALRNNLKAFVDKEEKNPLKIFEKYKKDMEDYDITFIDTAGRDVLDQELVKEIRSINKKISPSHIILVMPADIGQAAKRQADEFQKTLSINGVIITRMDSTAKGGGALTACSETKSPVFFITTGEQINDIETFDPQSFISRMLGLGDLNSLLEKVESVVDKKKQGKLQERLKEGKFTMNDLYEQLKSMEGLGSLSKIKNLIPGLGNAKIPDNMIETQEGKLKKFKFAIQSMTKAEIENPEIIEKQTQRISRIAKGAGINTSDVRALLKQYKMIKEFAKSGIAGEDISKGFSQKQMMKLAKKFGKRVRI